MELMNWFREPVPGQAVVATPGAGEQVEVWILGSSTFGAQLAAALGLPYAFASHFAPAQMMQALALYRERFRPSERLAKPHAMLGVHVVAAETDAEARFLFSSHQQALLNRRTGRPGKLPPPVDGFIERLDPHARAVIEASLGIVVVGGPATVRAGLAGFVARTGADELIVTAQIFDHGARKRSYALLAEVAADVVAA
jgi:luciferase family oxidoreductase group 1